MTGFFSIPDKEKDFQSYILYGLCILWSAVTGIIVSIGFYYFPRLWTRWLTYVCISMFIGIFNLTLNRLGYTRLASWTFTSMLWLYITIPCYSAGGIMAPGILSQMSVILTAGFLLGWRGGLAIGLLTMGTDFWLAYMEANGELPIPTVTHNPITRWIGAIIPFGTIIALQYYTTNSLRASLVALQREIGRREEAEKITNQTVYNLQERVKELKTLSAVSHILQDEDTPLKKLFLEIAEILPAGWQYPDITAARICFAGTEYPSSNYKPSMYSQQSEIKTDSGSVLNIEVVYLEQVPDSDEGSFLHEERNLITVIAEMIKMNLNRRERGAELRDYRYALDIGYMISIADADSCFTYVNDNFCKTSKYNPEELLGKHYGIIMSDAYSAEYLKELNFALQTGKPYRGEFCNKAKDGELYWIEATIVPFLDNEGKVYQYLTISHDITERKEAGDRIKQSEQLLKKITSQIPGNTYMFEIEENGNNKILFMSRGTDYASKYPDSEDIVKHADGLRETVYPDDKIKFNNAMMEAFSTESPLSIQYRVLVDGNIRWRWLQAVPEKNKNGKVLWYGASSDITSLVDYLVSIEQVIFDIAHVIRRPVSSMLGMTQLINDYDFSIEEVKGMAKDLHSITEEMDKVIAELNHAYHEKRRDAGYDFDISSLIDKRGSLFN